MQGLDTNVLVRFVVSDDDEQNVAARHLVAGLTPGDPGYIGLISVVEFVWVLRRTYGFTRETVATTLANLLANSGFVFEDVGDIEAAIFESTRTGTDIADALIARRNARAGCATTHTFDRHAARLAGMTLVRPATDAAAGHTD